MTTSYFQVIYCIFTHYTRTFLTKLLQANRILEQQLLFSGCSSIQILIYYSSPNKVSKAARIGYKSLCSTCVNYLTASHANDHQIFPTPFLGKMMKYLGMASILSIEQCPHVKLNSNLNVLVCSFYLCVRACYKVLYYC